MSTSNAPAQTDPNLVRAALSRASFMEPTWFAPSTWVSHAPFMFFLMAALRPKLFVELGSHYGYSFFAACQAARAYHTGTRCVAIDTWQGDEHAGFYSNIVHERVKAQLDANYADIAEMKRMTFGDAVGSFADGSIDLLHVDGRHYYADAKEDFETYLPKVSAGGIVLFHDTQVRTKEFGVWQLWAEIAPKYPSFEFHHGHGLGVIAIGAAPDALKGFFEIARNEKAAADVRAVYERLGAGLEGAAKAGRQAFKTGWKADAKRKARAVLAKAGIGG